MALDWHEAVAVTAALAGAVRHLRLLQAPAFDGIGLALDGEIGVTSDAVQEGTAAQGVAHVLERLLDAKPCPAELRQIASRYAVSDGTETASDALDQLLRELMFFERPGREELLRHLAQRTLVAVEHSRAADALDRVTERARLQPEPPLRSTAPRGAPMGETLAQMARRLAVPATVALLVTLGVAFATTRLLTTAEAPTRPESLGEPGEDEEVAPDAVPRAAPPAAETRPRAVPERVSEPAAPAPRVPAGRDRVLPVEPSPAAPPTGAGRGIDVRVKELGGAAVPPEPASRADADRRLDVVYGLGDRGVEPPVLIGPHLPAEPPADVPSESVGTLELTVSETGTVEHVRLISPSNRFQERMLVAAAKSWHFKPAQKDGRPVRFRTRIRVTL